MRIIEPAAGSLSIDTVGTDYTYDPWATSTAYAYNDIVRWRVSSTAAYYDYRCKVAHTSINAYNPSNTLFWASQGLSVTDDATTFETNVRLSSYPDWATGVAVVAGATKYDSADHHDYIAPNAITAGDNTIRPSEAVLSATPTIAARWVDAGSSNAWAPFDGLSNTYLIGRTAANNVLASVEFTFETKIEGRSVDCLFLSGLSGVGNVAADIVSVVDSDTGDTWTGFATMTEPVTLSDISLGGTSSYGQVRRSVVMPFTSIPAGYTVKIAVTLGRLAVGSVMRCSICSVGTIFELAYTEWNVESSLLDFSKIQRDETYGTVEFLKRGNANRLRANCFVRPSEVQGDVIYAILRKFSGIPLMLDFNNYGETALYDRLLVFGFYSGVRTIIQGPTFEVFSIDVEGLVS